MQIAQCAVKMPISLYCCGIYYHSDSQTMLYFSGNIIYNTGMYSLRVVLEDNLKSIELRDCIVYIFSEFQVITLMTLHQDS